MTLPDAGLLRAWLGREITWRGQRYRVVEILDDGPALVLESASSAHHIQPDAHGRPHREARDTLLIPVWDAETQKRHADFIELDAANPVATGQNFGRSSG